MKRITYHELGRDGTTARDVQIHCNKDNQEMNERYEIEPNPQDVCYDKYKRDENILYKNAAEMCTSEFARLESFPKEFLFKAYALDFTALHISYTTKFKETFNLIKKEINSYNQIKSSDKAHEIDLPAIRFKVIKLIEQAEVDFSKKKDELSILELFRNSLS